VNRIAIDYIKLVKPECMDFGYPGKQFLKLKFAFLPEPIFNKIAIGSKSH
jgi:hypothetical protein